jgi:hypothetical protein
MAQRLVNIRRFNRMRTEGSPKNARDTNFFIFYNQHVTAILSDKHISDLVDAMEQVGAHLLLQTRTQTLDGSLRSTFEKWYPGMANDNLNTAEEPMTA